MTLGLFVVGVVSFIFGLALGATSREKCPHDWQLVDKTEFKSKAEVLAGIGLKYNGTIPHDAVDRSVALAIRCSKCGALELKTLRSN